MAAPFDFFSARAHATAVIGGLRYSIVKDSWPGVE
jgi:hypothetical protein